MQKKVYVCLIADLLHAGHIKILKEAASLGEVTLGLLTLEACGELNDIPYLDYEKRKQVLESLSMVTNVIPQNRASYKDNLEGFKPDYVVHGDDWQYTYQKKYREEVLNVLKGWDGELVEVAYSSDISELCIKEERLRQGITTTTRQSRLRRLIASGKVIKILEVHNALSGLIAENASANSEEGEDLSFDGMWSSSLTDSTSKGKPDIEAVDTTARISTINEIFEVTTKPLIYDADTGGKPEHFEFTVKTLERTGVSAVIIEDKTGLKKNSLFGNDVSQTQDSIESFSNKIKMGKRAQITKDFMIIARVESLILDAGMNDALERSFAYVQAGADGIMIHSRQSDPAEIFEFIDKFRSEDAFTPLIVVPTSFNSVTTDEFKKRGVNVVIYANHMLRSAYPGMMKVAQSILQHKRSLEAEPDCMSIKGILNLIPGTK
jgi:phosphoenolpyruvate phosphomutase / 2-hydroxyethylphosphonate cytidylyltransferase